MLTPSNGEMRFGLATIVFVGTWAFNVHATAIPVYASVAWEGHQAVDTTAIQPAVDADDSMQRQAMTITELLDAVAPSDDIDALIGTNDFAVYVSDDTSDIHPDSLDQDSAPASLVREAYAPPSDYNYYFFLALVPLGFVGFAILRGWQGSQKERTRDLHASRRARHFG